jgi:diaminohydroxyphosphoribosylaminopyrimidine deaminase/5-amino-6-(5-phosphoribosylamino)uracil reductase
VSLLFESSTEQALMRRALELAGATRPHPNPRVGAVVLDAGGTVVGEGAHIGPGHPHAEIVALERAGSQARGGTLIVTLEPCSHQGRTPPCTGAVIEAGLRRIVVGAVDPDRRVAGSGIRQLQDAGVEVAVGVLAVEAEASDPAYFHHRRTGSAMVTLKSALTLDGQTAALDGTSRWITGESAREDGHRLRARSDAVLVGSGTVLADDPALDVRLAGYEGPQPRPVVVLGRRPIPATARVWSREPLVVAAHRPALPAGELVLVASNGGGQVDLAEALVRVADRGYLDVLVEGGAAIAASLWRHQLVDRGIFYLAGRLAGGRGLSVFDSAWESVSDARSIEIVGVARVGSDLRVEWETADQRASA